MRTWQAHGGKLRQMRFSPDGRTMATIAGQSKFVWLWDAATGERLAKLDTGAGRVQGLAFSSAGTFVAATGDNRTGRMWRTGPPIEPADHLDTISWPEVTTFLPGNDQFVAWTYQSLRVWDAPGPITSTPPRRPNREVPVPGTPYLFVTALRPAPDASRLLLVGSAVVSLRLPDLVEVRRDMLPEAGVAYDAAVSPDGRWLAVACGARNHVLDLHTGEWRAKPLYHKWGARAVAFATDGRSLLTAGADGLVRFWDTTTWTEARRFDFGIGKLRVAAISPDGTVAAAGSDTGQIVVWDVDG